MTVMKKFIQMLDEAGVGYKQYRGRDEACVVCLEVGDEKVDGYRGFVTEFIFDPTSGDLSKVNIEE
jgi:hypothetical protein